MTEDELQAIDARTAETLRTTACQTIEGASNLRVMANDVVALLAEVNRLHDNEDKLIAAFDAALKRTAHLVKK